jgi:hypothetical protein
MYNIIILLSKLYLKLNVTVQTAVCKIDKIELAAVAHSCNPSYLGG